MIVGVPKEIKIKENRVALVIAGVKSFVQRGHSVLIERNAGVAAGISDTQYEQAGARLVDVEEVWTAQMILKVKEPTAQEYGRLREGQLLFTFLHLAAEPTLTQTLLNKGVTGIAYETVQLPDLSLPLLTPSSEVAGRMSVQVGAMCLEKHHGGKGMLLGGVPGVARARVAVLGGGVAGLNAIKMAVGQGAAVTVLDINATRLAYLDDIFGSKITTLMSNADSIERVIPQSDLVISTVLLVGNKAPVLVRKELVQAMEAGSVIVDVAIDQGGCFETIRPTTHENPTYIECGVNHYGVTNMPGAVPRTSTYALTNVTLKYALELADKGLYQALEENRALKLGLNTYQGKLMHKGVGEALSIKVHSYEGR